jgi:hypothetical protein
MMPIRLCQGLSPETLQLIIAEQELPHGRQLRLREDRGSFRPEGVATDVKPVEERPRDTGQHPRSCSPDLVIC